MTNRIAAVHIGNGVWEFTCFAHETSKVNQLVSSPKQAVDVMREHCDLEHVGQQMLLQRTSQYSGDYRRSYVGKTDLERARDEAGPPGR